MSTSSIPIYLISLEKDQDRRNDLAARFDRHYASMQYSPAVDGRKLTAQEFFSFIAKPLAHGRRLMLPGEVGCSLSHINALESFLTSGKPCALILEDDVIGTDESIDNLLNIVPFLPESSLTICGGQEGMPARKYILGTPTNADGLFRIARFSYNEIFRTCCYIVTRTSAKRILTVHAESLQLADAWGRFFLNTDTEILYTQQFSHPKELDKSHLEHERALFGHKSEFGNRNIIPRLKRRLERVKRKLYKVYFLLKGYRRIVK